MPVVLLPVYQVMVDTDCAALEIAILPAQADDLTDAATCTQKHREQRQPVTVLLRSCDIADKSCLLFYRQRVTLWLIPVMTFLDLSHNAVSRICTDIAVPYRQCEYRVQNGIDDFHTVWLKTTHNTSGCC